MPSLAIVTPVFPPYVSGMGAVAAKHAALFASRGYDVHVYTPRYASLGVCDAFERRDGYAVHWMRPRFAIGNAAWIETDEAFRDNDIVHLHYPFFFSAHGCARTRRKFPQKKFFITYHMDPAAPSIKGWYFAWYAHTIALHVLASADRVFVSTRDYPRASRSRAFFISHADRVVEAPFGVDAEKFLNPISSSVPSIVTSFAVAKRKEAVAFFVGGMDRPHAYKGIRVLLEALAQTKSKVRLVLVGDGALRLSYIAYADALGLKDRVQFVGAQTSDAVSQFYHGADFLVLPSLNRAEAFGLVLLEAMASGIPCIASDLPGVSSVLGAGAYGVLVPPGDARALAQAMDTFAQDLLACKTLGARAQAYVHTAYTWSRFADRYEACYTHNT